PGDEWQSLARTRSQGARGAGEGSTVQRTEHTERAAVEHVGVDLRGGDVLVPEQLLDGADVVAVLEQVGGEGVAQRVRRDRLVDAGRAPRPADRAPDHSVVQVVAAHDAVARIPRAA